MQLISSIWVVVIVSRCSTRREPKYLNLITTEQYPAGVWMTPAFVFAKIFEWKTIFAFFFDDIHKVIFTAARRGEKGRNRSDRFQKQRFLFNVRRITADRKQFGGKDQVMYKFVGWLVWLGTVTNRRTPYLTAGCSSLQVVKSVQIGTSTKQNYSPINSWKYDISVGLASRSEKIVITTCLSEHRMHMCSEA